MASGINCVCSTINERKKQMNNRKKFWLSLICDYQEDFQDGDVDFVLSKGHLMCWISFAGLMTLPISQMFGIKYDVSNLTIAIDCLKTIFTTTFMYSAFKVGAKVYDKSQQTTQNGD